MIPSLQLGQFGRAGSAATPPAPDPDYASVVVLLHGDGADGSTTFTDNAPAPAGGGFSANGNVQIDTAQFMFGGASILFDGSGDFLAHANSADFNFGTGDFTVECWARFNSLASDCVIAGNYQNSTNGWTLQTVSGKVAFYASGDGPPEVEGGTTVTTGVWYHIAVARVGTDLRLFLDGVQDDSATDSTNITSTANTCIGRTGAIAAYMNGWLDDFRITKGVGRYTAGFTPAGPFPNF